MPSAAPSSPRSLCDAMRRLRGENVAHAETIDSARYAYPASSDSGKTLRRAMVGPGMTRTHPTSAGHVRQPHRRQHTVSVARTIARRRDEIINRRASAFPQTPRAFVPGQQLSNAGPSFIGPRETVFFSPPSEQTTAPRAVAAFTGSALGVITPEARHCRPFPVGPLRLEPKGKRTCALRMLFPERCCPHHSLRDRPLWVDRSLIFIQLPGRVDGSIPSLP